MPIYEYRCEANDTTLEVSHPMSTTVRSWGQLCEIAGIETGKTPADAPVEKLISMPIAHGSDKPNAHAVPPGGCGSGCGCVRH
ncbi:MAG: hypothetical protein R3B67_06765 [Phycisphaerales bacterium]